MAAMPAALACQQLSSRHGVSPNTLAGVRASGRAHQPQCLRQGIHSRRRSSGSNGGTSTRSSGGGSGGINDVSSPADGPQVGAAAAAAAVSSFREDVRRQHPLPLQVGFKMVPALKQYSGQHLAHSVAQLAAALATCVGADSGGRVEERARQASQELLTELEQHELQALLDEVAGEVVLRMANQHSGRDVFHAADVVSLTGGFAALAALPTSSASSRMLDAVAGFVVSRVASRHLNAVSRPQDVIPLLQHYSALQHDSVAVPEIVAAMGEQLRRQVASVYERATYSGGAGVAAANSVSVLVGGRSSGDDTDGGSIRVSFGEASDGAAAAAGPGDHTCMNVTQVVEVFECYVALRQLPDARTLRALVTQTCWQLSSTDQQTCLRLLRLLAAFRYNPGQWVLELLATRLAGLRSLDNVAHTARCLADVGFCPPGQVAAMLLERALEECARTLGESPGSASSSASSTPQLAAPQALSAVAHASASWGCLDASGLERVLQGMQHCYSATGIKALDTAAGGSLWQAAAAVWGIDTAAGEATGSGVHASLLSEAYSCHESQAQRSAVFGLPLWVQDARSYLEQEGAAVRVAATYCGAPLLLVRPAGRAREGGGDALPVVALDVECWTCSEPHTLSSWASLDLRLTEGVLGQSLALLPYYEWAALRGGDEKRAYVRAHVLGVG